MKGSQCAFVQFTQRSAAEAAADKAFNKLIINGKRMNIKWGKSQAQQGLREAAANKPEEPQVNPVPGLPGGKYSVNKTDYWEYLLETVSCTVSMLYAVCCSIAYAS